MRGFCETSATFTSAAAQRKMHCAAAIAKNAFSRGGSAARHGGRASANRTVGRDDGLPTSNKQGVAGRDAALQIIFVFEL